MEFFGNIVEFVSEMSMGAKLVILLLFFVGSVGQWKLYDKAGQNGWTIFVPVLNLIVLNRVVGRPASHVWYYFIPVFNIYFVARVFIEVCQSFGKNTIFDYVLVILLNGFYILNLGLSYDETYKGPVYGKNNETKSDSPSLGKAEFA